MQQFIYKTSKRATVVRTLGFDRLQERQYTYDVTVRRVRVTIVIVEKQ
jgi:hypothetical protein